MMTPKTPCPNCAVMRYRDWCLNNCSLSVAAPPEPSDKASRAKKELMRAIPLDDGSIDMAKAREILELNAMRSLEDQRRAPKPVRIVSIDRIYPSVAQAARIVSDLTTRDIKQSDVINVCTGRYKSLYGIKVEYVRLEVDG